jgi:hypothetical protein
MQHKLLHPRRLYTLFKYAVYLALLFNFWLFLQEDVLGADVWADQQASWRDLAEAFAQTIDSLAWVCLLLLFELETSFLDDAALARRRVRWSLHGLRGFCALVIIGSVIGYTGKLQSYLGATPFDGEPCALAGQSDWSLLVGHDEWEPLDTVNCATAGAAPSVLHDAQVLAPAEVLGDAVGLAWVDVVNAVAWMLVVVLLEFDVRMQLRHALRGWVMRASAAAKIATYAVLMGAAVYWGVEGDFLDFWDAFLWLVAFVFIEMNLFQWQREGERVAREPVVRAG